MRERTIHFQLYAFLSVAIPCAYIAQIDELDRRLRHEQETSRRLRSAVTILKGRLQEAEIGRKRCNGIERAFFSFLAESEALLLQREMLMRPGDITCWQTMCRSSGMGKLCDRNIHPAIEDHL